MDLMLVFVNLDILFKMITKPAAVSIPHNIDSNINFLIYLYRSSNMQYQMV